MEVKTKNLNASVNYAVCTHDTCKKKDRWCNVQSNVQIKFK